MRRILVIPDVHLKPEMFDRAEAVLFRMKKESGDEASAVCLGDLADDWRRQYDMPLYERTYARARRFAEKFPDTIWCLGNHDVSYLWPEGRNETGYSTTYEYLIRKEIKRFMTSKAVRDGIRFVARIGRTLFSHAGVMKAYVEAFVPDGLGDVDAAVDAMNGFGAAEMWNDLSPIWIRPQRNRLEAFPKGFLQVVGHTPMKEISYDAEREILSCDVFSTDRNRMKYGEERFVEVDPDAKTWRRVDE